MMTDLIQNLESRLTKVLQKHPGLEVYTFSLEGHYIRSNKGAYKFLVHFNDSTAPGGVRHVEVSGEDSVGIERYREIEAWMKALGARFKVQRPISSDLNGPS